MERQQLQAGDVQQPQQEVHLHPPPPTDVQQPKQHEHLNAPPPSPAAAAVSSPSHEFSFTISLHSSKSKSPPAQSVPPTAVDLSPADEIFFHGHLLPLQLLSHLPPVASPRASIGGREDQNHINSTKTVDRNCLQKRSSRSSHDLNTKEGRKSKPKSKSKSFSLLRIPSNWGKEGKPNPNDDVSNHQRQKTIKSKFDAMKRFLRSIKLKPRFLPFRKANRGEFQHNPYYSSYSGNLTVKNNKKETRGHRRRGDYSSAPATMGSSPTNSGVLVASGTVSPTGKSDSTMEELQAAIQAAIAHCKNSIANEDRIKAA